MKNQLDETVCIWNNGLIRCTASPQAFRVNAFQWRIRDENSLGPPNPKSIIRGLGTRKTSANSDPIKVQQDLGFVPDVLINKMKIGLENLVLYIGEMIYYISFKREGKMKRILCFVWLPQWARWTTLSPSGFTALDPQDRIPRLGHIKKNPLCTEFSRLRRLNNGLFLCCLFIAFRLVSVSRP